MSNGTRNFDPDLDEADTSMNVEQSTAGGTDTGHVSVRFTNGATGRVVTAEIAWFQDFSNCSGFDVTAAFGRVIG
jgi:hypothetical protein